MANENAQAAATAMPEPQKRSKSWIIVVVLMAVEGAAVFFGTKFLTGPAGPAVAEADESRGSASQAGHGEAAHGEKAAATQEFAEVEVAECRPVNKVSGKLITFRMRISVLIRSSDAERAKALVEGNKARINDRINLVIRSADPSHFNEPALETIKRRLKSEFENVLGDEKLIQEILIPEMLPSGPGL
jgi:flagellar basal body-associated protein FliL